MREKTIEKLEKAMIISEAANECRVVIGYGLVEDIVQLLKDRTLVQCCDCENWDTDWKPVGGNGQVKEIHYCPMVDSITSFDWFCGYAKKKEP